MRPVLARQFWRIRTPRKYVGISFAKIRDPTERKPGDFADFASQNGQLL
jgi:hypothetical protein